MARIGVLGPLSVDGAVGILPPREQVVLAALTVRRGEVVSAQTLADAWWGERPPPTWTKAVQGCLVQLRKVLGAAAIETRAHGYCLVVPADQIDACRFERQVVRAQELLTLGEPDRAAYAVDDALAMWRGRALTDVEEWEPGRVEAARLEALRLDAEDVRLDAMLRSGRCREVLAEALTRVTEQPLREHRWTLLALAQYQAGRQGDALRTLRRARRVLIEELGLDPGPDLLTMEQAILLQDPSLVAAQLPAPSPTCPYLGLVPYGEGDAEAFFGRDATISACLRRLADTGVLAVVGPSGCGKSSLVRAGLAATIARDGRRVIVITPGARPMDALTAVPVSGRSPVLVVDQLEEAVTLCTDLDERAAFFDSLTERAEAAPLIVALRADRLGDLSVHSGFARIVERGISLLQAMDEGDLRAAIEGPARQAGLLLEPGLVDLLVREVEGEPGALPLLSHALHQTWQRRERRTLTVAGYQSSGGIRGAVAQSAEDVYARTRPDRRPILRDLLLRLVAPSPEGEPVRSRVPRRVVADDAEHEQIVEQLITARLVTSDADAIELAHEALVRAWPRLRGWLDDDVDGQRIWRHLAVAADAWAATGHPDGELYRGTRLDRAIEWRRRATPHLNTVEHSFLDASRAAADGQRRWARRRRRTLTAILAGAAATALALGSLAVVQARRATTERDHALVAEQDAELEALVNRSLALRSTDRAAGALLAVEAYRRAPGDPRAQSALLGTFTAAPGFIGYSHLPVDSLPLSGAVVPGASTAVVAVNGRELELLDLETGRLESRFPPSDGRVVPMVARHSDVQVSADGRYVAHLVPADADAPCLELDVLRVTDGAGCAALFVFDIASGRRVLGPVTPPFGPSDLAINADGSLIAIAGGYDGKVVVYGNSSAEPIGVLPGIARPAAADLTLDTAAVAFGPDGLVYAGSMAGPVRAVDPVTLEVVATYDAPALATHTNLAVTGEGLVVGSGDAHVVAIDTQTGAVRWSNEFVVLGDPNPCLFFAVSEPMQRIYCGNEFGVLDERDLATGQRTGLRLDPQLGSVGDLAIAAEGRELVAFGRDVAVVSRWRIDGSGPLVDTSAEGWLAERYDPSGELLIVTRRDDVEALDAAVWDPAAGEVVDHLDEIDRVPLWVSPELVAAAFVDGTAGLYDVRRHARVATVEELAVAPSAPAAAWVAADGARVWVSFVIGEDPSHCEIWSIDVAAGEPVEPTFDLDGCGWVESVSATADGRRIAITASSPLGWATTIHDAETGERLAGPLLGPRTTTIGPDDLLVGGDSTGAVTQYDLATLEPIGTFPGSRGAIDQMGFSVDGTLLAVGSRNQILSIYDVATRTRLGDPIITDAPFDGTKGALRPDGGALAINGPAGLIIWDLDPSRLVDAACRVAGRNLTAAEWNAYLGNTGPHRATCPDYP